MSESSLIEQAYRFALAPSARQEDLLRACAGASRFWFNQGLALVKRRLDERASGANVDVPWTYKSLCSAFRGEAIKDQLAPWRDQVVTGSYQAGLEALGKALQNFSRGRREGRKAGFPRFRRKGRCNEVVIFQRPRLLDSRHVCLDRRRLGPVRTKESTRKLTRLLARDPHARIMRATVKREHGTWFISFTVRRSTKQRQARRPSAIVGVDVGLSRLATTSIGNSYANARPLQHALRTLRRLERRLDRQRRANNPDNYLPDGQVRRAPSPWVKSRRMVATERRIAKVHARVANVRRQQAHRLTTDLVREFGVIGVETLAVKDMLKNKRLARHIADVGWGMALSQLRYKTSWSDGSLLVAADRFYPSSKMCSACGAVKAKLRLADRVFTCDNPGCGCSMDRDLNAALNLARMAQRRAQAEGSSKSYVARIGRFTCSGTPEAVRAARGGQVSLVLLDERSPVKREDSTESPQSREALAAA